MWKIILVIFSEHLDFFSPHTLSKGGQFVYFSAFSPDCCCSSRLKVLSSLPPSPQIEHKAPHLRHDVIEANFYSGTLADAYGMDVLDLHFQFRFLLHHRTKDGVHWNALAHRRITSLLLQHTAEAWGVIMPCPLTAVGEEDGFTHTHTHRSKYTLPL